MSKRKTMIRFGRRRSQIVLLILCVVFAAVGVFLFSQSRAATPFLAVEPEKGSIQSAKVITDTAASGGSAVQFTGKDCALTSQLYSNCGVLWGFYHPGNADVRFMEANTGRQFDIVRRYYSLAQTPSKATGTWNWPSATDQELMAGGRILHITLSAKVFGGSAPTSIDGQTIPAPNWSMPSENPGTWYGYMQVASGAIDPLIIKVAKHIKSSPYRFIIDFTNEGMDTTNAAFGATGTPARDALNVQFAQAFRHMRDVFDAQGVTNVQWSWTVGGFDTDKTYRDSYPGDKYVDWIMWDPYNQYANSWKTPYDTFARFYNRLENGILDPVSTQSKNKLWGLAEYGCMDDPRRPAWMQDVPAALQRLPKIKAVEYFNSGTWGAFSDQPTITAFGAAGKNPYLNPLNR